MHGRIPLATALSTSGRRHAVPHRTYVAPREGAFFSYLNSDDTRLPRHPFLRAIGRPAEEYDSYVGEDVWNTSQACSSNEDDMGEPIECDEVIDWILNVLEEDWAKDGVVLCGRYVVADDCTWAVPSRSPTLFSPYEICMVMRNSVKFLEDVATQVADGARADAEFTLAKSLAGSGAKEMRALVPYRVRQNKDGSIELAPAMHHYAGICQRFTEVCFPSLMSWSETEHDEFFHMMMERVKKAALLERTCRTDTQFLHRLLQAYGDLWRQVDCRRYFGSRTDARAAIAPVDCLLLLSVDLLFESASLPIHVLSGRVRVFPSESMNPTAEAGEKDVAAGAPFMLEPVELSTGEGTTEAGPAAAADAGLEIEESDAEAIEHISSFLRLFRDEENWNRYVEAMDGRQIDDLRYCVVASEAGDLLTCPDTHSKRGLPLELRRPELLQLNPEGVAILERLRETILSSNTAAQ